MKRQFVSTLGVSVLAFLGSVISACAQTVVGSVSLGSQPAGQVAVDPNTGRIYVAGGYAQNQVTVVNVSDMTHPTVVTTISGSGGGSGVTVNPNTNFFYTSNGFGGQVLKYDGATNTLLATASIGACPGAFDIDPISNLVYVTRQCAGGGPPRGVDPLFVLDGGSLAIIGNNLGTGGVVSFPKLNTATGVVYVCSSGGDDVWGPFPTFTPITILTAGCVSAVNAVTNRLYLGTASGIQVLDGNTNSLTATIVVANAWPQGVNTSLNRVYVVDLPDQVVKVIDGATNTVVGSFSLSPGVTPVALAVDSGKNLVYVAGAASGSTTLFVVQDTANQPPVASLSPASLNLGSQLVGTTSAAQTVTLTNSGGSTLNFTSVAVTGTNSGDFGETHTCGPSLAASANCTISVTFTPTATGARAASLTITDNASNSPQTVNLGGTGTAPAVTLSPTSLTFASQVVGTTSAVQTLTLTNSGSATLTISSFAINNDFAQTNTCGSSVAAGASCTVSVTFTPTATGARTGSLTISDNAGSGLQSISLSGTGAPATTKTSISAPSVTFNANGVVTVTVTSSLGTVTGNVSLVVDGGAAITQALSGGSTVFPLTSPNAGDHSLTASYAAQGNFDASSATATLNVNKATPTINWANPADIVYGTPLGGSQLNATASFNGSPLPGSFVYTPPAGTVLGAGAGQVLSVTFTPTDTTDFNNATATAHINVAKAPPTITWANPADIVYGTALGSSQLNATTSFNGSPLPGSFVYTPPTGTVLSAGAGQALSVSFTPTDTTNFNNATGTVHINVLPAPLTVTAGNATRPYGAANPTFTATTSGFVNGDTLATAVSGSPSLTTTATQTSNAGTYPIVAAQGTLAAANYTFIFVNGTLTVTPVALAITANNATKVLDAPNPSFTATYSGFVLGQDPSVLTGTLGCTSTATTTSPVGSYPITCSGQSSPNYAITYVSGTLKVLYAAAGTVCDGDAGHSILAPISALGVSVFKQGSTVPAKFRVCDASGVSIGTPGVVSSFLLTQIIAGTVTDVNDSVASTNPDTAFRFDSVSQQWIFNMSTTNLPAGATYVFVVSLNDGTTIRFQYGLK